MGKRVNPRQRVTPRSISFHRRQIDFLDWVRENEGIEFDINNVCRDALDQQIAIINREFLENEKTE